MQQIKLFNDGHFIHSITGDGFNDPVRFTGSYIPSFKTYAPVKHIAIAKCSGTNMQDGEPMEYLTLCADLGKAPDLITHGEAPATDSRLHFEIPYRWSNDADKFRMVYDPKSLQEMSQGSKEKTALFLKSHLPVDDNAKIFVQQTQDYRTPAPLVTTLAETNPHQPILVFGTNGEAEAVTFASNLARSRLEELNRSITPHSSYQGPKI